MISEKLDPKKALDHDQITARILQELPRKGLLMLTYFYNAILRLRYISKLWKRAKILMIQKSDKAPEKPNSFRLISFLSVISKLFEELYTRRLIRTVEDKNLIPDYQFGFRAKHSKVEQVH